MFARKRWVVLSLNPLAHQRPQTLAMKQLYLKIVLAFCFLWVCAPFLGAQENGSARAVGVQQRAFARKAMARLQSGKRAAPRELDAVKKLLEGFEKNFGKIGDEASFGDIKQAVKNISDIDVSNCPYDVSENWKILVGDMGAYVGGMERIFKTAGIEEADSLKESFRAQLLEHPELLKEVSKQTEFLQKSVAAFALSVLPYMAQLHGR